MVRTGRRNHHSVQPRVLVSWEVYPGTTVILPRQDARDMADIIDAFDAIPFVWSQPTGWLFALMPRPPELTS